MATIYKQFDRRWKNLRYPKRCTVGGSGCALVGLTNLLIEYPRYKDATPITFYNYMRQFAVDYDGTKRAGVATALKHYGFKDVQRFQSRPIKDAWSLLAKGYRGLFVMSSNRGGSKKILWTTTGHYIATTDYKVQNGKHYLYCKDSGGRGHDGWYTYEDHMRGAVSDVIIGIPTDAIKKSSDNTSSEKKASDKVVKAEMWDKNVTLLAQKKFCTPQDGIVSGQNSTNEKYHMVMDPASWKYGKGGSTLVWSIQKTIGVTTDGQFGPATIKALQKALGVTADGYFGKQSLEAFKKYLNGELTLKKNTTTKTTKTNREKLAETANNLAYASAPSSAKYPSGKPKDSYKTALNKAYPSRVGWGSAAKAGASCDVFVGTCLRYSGIDKNFPRGLAEQIPYLKKHTSLYQEVKLSEVKTGDIVVYAKKTGGSHIYIYYNGKAKEANYNSWYGITSALGVRLSKSGKKWIRAYRVKDKATTTKTPQEKAVEWAVKIANNNSYGYKRYTSDANTHKCPICHPKSGLGFNCIGFVGAALHHGGGIDVKCSMDGLLNNSFADKVTEESWRARNGKNWKMISNGDKKSGSPIPVSKLKKGDVLLKYDADGSYQHTALYIGNGQVVESATDKVAKSEQIRISKYSGRYTRVFRYTGK